MKLVLGGGISGIGGALSGGPLRDKWLSFSLILAIGKTFFGAAKLGIGGANPDGSGLRPDGCSRAAGIELGIGGVGMGIVLVLVDGAEGATGIGAGIPDGCKEPVDLCGIAFSETDLLEVRVLLICRSPLEASWTALANCAERFFTEPEGTCNDDAFEFRFEWPDRDETDAVLLELTMLALPALLCAPDPLSCVRAPLDRKTGSSNLSPSTESSASRDSACRELLDTFKCGFDAVLGFGLRAGLGLTAGLGFAAGGGTGADVGRCRGRDGAISSGTEGAPGKVDVSACGQILCSRKGERAV